jgi:hypothetical protein
MATPYSPTLLCPNGEETLLGGSTFTIKWTLPNPPTPDDRPVQVEVYFTDNYSSLREPGWRQIAVVPAGTNAYAWRVDDFVHTNKARIAVRTRNARGERSPFSISAGNFSINHRKLTTPAVISPVSGGRYDKYIEIVPDDQALAGTYSQRSLYQFFYSSASKGVSLTPIAQDVPVGTASVVWNTIDIPPADDYVISVFVEDDSGSKSDALEIDNISIVHEGFFLIDTTPPVATVTVNGGDEFTRFRDVTVNIVTFDETTGVQSMQLIEGENAALPEPVAGARPFTVSSGDGTKVIQLVLQDFGANRNDLIIQRLFDTLIEQSGVIIDLAIGDGTAWVVTSGSANYLYTIVDYPQIVYTFADVPTAVSVFNSLAYVATKSAANKGTLFRYTGALSVESIKTFSEADSVVNCMETHGTVMYIGFENGNVYSYDGSVLTNIASLPNPIKNLVSDGNSLYLSMQNDDSVYIYNGSGFVKTGG